MGKCPITKLKEFLGFRCPFEVKGQQENTIIEIALSEPDRTSRMKAIAGGFHRFHVEQPESIGLKFILPRRLLEECPSLETLHAGLLPYQSEMLAAELDFRLNPFLPYQSIVLGKEKFFKAVEADPWRARAAHVLLTTCIEQGMDTLDSPLKLADHLQTIILLFRKEGFRNPAFQIADDDGHGNAVPLIGISMGTVDLHFEHPAGRADETNRNCFSVVKTPFYPPEFGRWSEDIEIVMTKERHFVSLPSDIRRKIRAESNAVLQRHGIAISNLEEDKPEGDGLWIPNMGSSPG